MKRLFPRILMICLLLMSLFAMSIDEDHVSLSSHEVLYHVSSQAEAVALSKEYNIEIVHVSPSGVALFHVNNPAQIDSLLQQGFSLNQESHVNRPPFQSSVDPYLKDQYAISMMETNQAWSLTLGSREVVVAIIDSGIDINHPEFIGRISPKSYNSRTWNVGVEYVIDDFGHGTMVAGIIGAAKDNAKGIVGVAPNTTLMIIKANNEASGSFTDNAIIEGIYYAVNNGANIINFSLGGGYANPLTKKAIDYAISKGVYLVGATGNDGTDFLAYPAAFNGVLSVGAVDKSGVLADYSNYGTGLDLVAPGSDIITTTRNKGYGIASGTSFAAPQVSGVLALLLSYEPDLAYEEVLTRVVRSATDKGVAGYDTFYGRGIVNSYKPLITDYVKVTTRVADVVFLEFYTAINRPIGKLTTPLIPNQVFAGWYLEETFETFWDPMLDPVTSDLVLYGKFLNDHHTVFYVHLEKVFYQETVKHGEYPTLPEVSFEGRVFLGWMSNARLTTSYVPAPVLKDTTIYLKTRPLTPFKLSYILNGNLLAEDIVLENATPVLREVNTTGYTFSGWFLDSSLQTPYQVGPMSKSLSLYGRIVSNPMVIRFHVGDEITEITLSYGRKIVYRPNPLANLVFIGWYYDADFTQPYNDELITEEWDLYAKFVPIPLTITYVLDGKVIGTIHYDPNAYQLKAIDLEGLDFFGWYLDASFTTLFEGPQGNYNITLYGYTQVKQIQITLYLFDGSIWKELVFQYGDAVSLEETPPKPSSRFLSFDFLDWEMNTFLAKENLGIYPKYQIRLSQEIKLYPGVDTITLGESWEDKGVRIKDPYITIDVENPVNQNQVGKYLVKYRLMCGDILLDTLFRYVQVLPANEVVSIVLNPGITTLFVGMEYQEAGATALAHEVEIIGSVNTMVPGIYPIIYRVTTESGVTQVTRFVHVIQTSPVLNQPQAWAIYRKEEYYYVA